MSTTEFATGKDFTASGSNFTAKGQVLSEFRGLQADLNLYAKAAGFDGVTIDGIVGPRTLEAVKRVVAAVLARNSLLIPVAFTANNSEEVARYAPRIREWLHTTAAKTLDVSPYRVYEQGVGKDWNIKGDFAYGADAVHDEFMGIQRELNKVAKVVGFQPLAVDGFIGPRTAAAVKQTFDKVVAKNPLFGVTLFPPPDTKEETAAFAAFIRDWLVKVATKQLLGSASA